MFEHLLTSLFLAVAPISEIRGAIIYILFVAHKPLLIFPAMLANWLVSPAIIFFWDLLKIPYWGRLFLGKKIDLKKKRMAEKYEKYGILGITLFIGIPLPVTGVYTGTLIAELLGIKKRDILIASAVGVVMASVIVFALAEVGIMSY